MRTEKPVERRETLSVAAPLISVIVPIYNVERYVRKCLDSLKVQTLREIEIICIDDGSTDNSSKIADEYASQDWPVFRVIHTENRGLSVARNRGIDEARSEWLMFVDGDDWVDEKFCEIPYKAAIEYRAELVIFGFWYVKHGKKKSKEIPVGLVDEMTAHELGTNAVWNKLYKYELFTTIRYPNGRVYEDIATTHKLVHEAPNVYLLNEPLYYYVKRKGSIMHTHTISNLRDLHIASLERNNDLISYGYPLNKLNICGTAMSYLSVVPPCDDRLYKKAKEIIDSIDDYPKELTLKQKIGLFIWRNDRKLFYLVCRGLRRL